MTRLSIRLDGSEPLQIADLVRSALEESFGAEFAESPRLADFVAELLSLAVGGVNVPAFSEIATECSCLMPDRVQ